MAGWMWPVPGISRISSGYGNRNSPTSGASSNHKGIDISEPGNGDIGRYIVASRDGKVTRSASSSSYGNVIYISHGDGYESRYAHLNERRVSVGDTVRQGQVIGTLGNTGVSTGAHLHFEILYDGVAQNPTRFVSYNNSITNLPLAESGSSINGDADYSESNTGVSSYNPDYVVGRRVSDLTNQAIHAYVNLYVGDQKLSTNPDKPNIIQSLEFQRIKGAGGKGTITLFDDTWYQIEKLFQENWNNIYMEYGYVDGNEPSRYYKVILGTYTLSFNETGIIMRLSVTSEPVYKNLQSINLDTNTKKPSVAIGKICKHVGWDLDVRTVAKAVSDRADNYELVNENPASYIIDTIIPEARSPEGDILVFHVNESNKAILRPATYSEALTKGDIKTYIYQRGYDSSVISVDFDVKGVFGGAGILGTVTEATVTTHDTNTKEELTYTESISSVNTVTSGDQPATPDSQSSVIAVSAGASPLQTQNRLYYSMKISSMAAFEATITVVGDLDVEVTDDIRLIVIQDDGLMHPVSGIYMVSEVIDSISNGNFTTTIKAVRNGSENTGGDINEGVILANPKSFKLP